MLLRLKFALSVAFIVSRIPLAEASSPAVCRVHNQLGGFANVGSGTLVDKTPDGREGLVLTCWHLFREGTGNVVVEFPDGRTHGAKVVALDQRADLAALAIAKPQAAAVAVNLAPTSGQLSACGFGHSGQLRCAVGRGVGTTEAPGQTSLLINGAVRSGDSGGGVFDDQGRLVAVVWGERDGVTYASCGQPLRNFLERVLGRRTQYVVNCPGGICPRPFPPQRAVASPPTAPGPGTARLAFDELAAAIAELRETKQDRGDYVTRAELTHLETENASRHKSLLERVKTIAAGGSPSVGRAAGAAAVGLLGLSGPVGWAVLAAGTVGGWLVGRRRNRKLDGAGGRRRPFRESRVGN